MSNETKTVETKVTKEEVNLDEIFNEGVTTESVMTSGENSNKQKFLQVNPEVDMSFAETKTKTVDTPAEAVVEETTPEPTPEPVDEVKPAEVKSEENVDTSSSVIDNLGTDEIVDL